MWNTQTAWGVRVQHFRGSGEGHVSSSLQGRKICSAKHRHWTAKVRRRSSCRAVKQAEWQLESPGAQRVSKDRLSRMTRRAALSLRDHYSVTEVAVTQLLVDPLSDKRHVLLTEEKRLLHGETTAVLTKTNEKNQWGEDDHSQVSILNPLRAGAVMKCAEAWGRKDTLETQRCFTLWKKQKVSPQEQKLHSRCHFSAEEYPEGEECNRLVMDC